MENRGIVRFGSVVRVKPEHWEEYRKLHEAVWPELLALFRSHHIRHFSIFHKDGVLFSYKEYTGTDYERDMAELAKEPLMHTWWELTDRCQIPFVGDDSGGLWSDMQEIFHME